MITEKSIIKYDGKTWIALLQNDEYTAFCLYSQNANGKTSKSFGIGDCFIIPNCLLAEWLNRNAIII